MESVIRCQGLAVPVEHGNSQQVYLEKDQETGSEGTPNSVEPITRHDTPLYSKFYETGYPIL